jgi:hypothetical protein
MGSSNPADQKTTELNNQAITLILHLIKGKSKHFGLINNIALSVRSEIGIEGYSRT